MMLLLVLGLHAYAPQRAGAGPLTDPALEQKAHLIAETIRCAVCQGLSVADSPSPMAQAMFDRVREMVQEGKSDDDIRAYFAERYGEWILLEPKASGFNWLVWLLPLVFVAGGVIVIARKTGSAATPAASETADDEYLKSLRDEVDT